MLCLIFQITPQEKPQPEVQQTGYLQSWFPGWGGWGGSVSQTPTQSSSGTNVDSDVGEPPPVKAEQEQDLGNISWLCDVLKCFT